MWRCVALVTTYISEERISSIFRVEIISKLVFLGSVLQLPVAANAVPSSLILSTVMMEGRSRKLRLTTVGDPPRWPRDTPLSTKVDTKFRWQVAVAQSVYFARGLRATEFVFCFVLWWWRDTFPRNVTYNKNHTASYQEDGIPQLIRNFSSHLSLHL
jgi:hypothetical protein